MMLQPSTEDLPSPLAAQAQTAWDNILERGGTAFAEALGAITPPPDTAAQLARVLASSPFVADLLRSKPHLLVDLLASGELHQSLVEEAFGDGLRLLLEAEDAELLTALRCFRQRHMLRIVWRDFCRLADTLETVRDTSLMAEAAIAIALDECHLDAEQKWGSPIGADTGEKQQLVVLAMGKLGARELNISSDIDLIFTFPEAGKTEGSAKSLSNEEFFTRVGRGLINALDQVTAEGFVFRVDMRLRPYGDSGALVHNFTALESYYQDQGRDWERYALIKARPVTGNPQRAQELMDTLRPFVYRRYVDFGVIDSLRDMKRMINDEVRRRGLDNNVKLGHGGIREVEFIAQCFQLIRGGRDRGLQQRELLLVLQECSALGCLPVEAADQLRDAYLYLRDSEHAIQGYRDKQSQDLPDDELHRQAMACVMGASGWQGYLEQLEHYRETVAEHFRELIAAPEDESAEDTPALWGDGLTEQALADAGYARPAEMLQALHTLLEHGRVVTLQAEGRARFEHFMPLLLAACAEAPRPDLALERVLPLVMAVLRRSAYLVLLMENPPALVELVSLCGASPWIAEQMASNPVLLDEFLDRGTLYSAPDKELLRSELNQLVARLPLDDLEAQMDTLRYFKASHVLRVAASELAGRLPLMQVSDKLTFIAEVILEHVLAIAWADLTRKHGEPARDSAGTDFVIYAYGKLGGIELGYSSDLDLVFLHGAHKNGFTGGERSIDNATFYTRLGQRMIHILETRMTMGQLYEVDMRLRPSGASGMLVSTLEGFDSYQRDTAWTWEHQALVRARFVAGDELAAEQVESVRLKTLCQPRDEAVLAREVIAMREKMREHLLSNEEKGEGEFHLKQGWGGIVDIEFMVQYAVLAWSHREPELARWSDNVRILETLGREGFFEQRECDALTGAYIAYRSAAHQLSLQQQPGVAPAGDFVAEREAVNAKWQGLFAPYLGDESNASSNNETD